MQSNNFLRPFSTNTTNIYSDSDIATLSVIGTGAVNNAIADSKLYNSLSATTTLACTALIDFVALQNPSVNFGQTLPIDNWISAVTNAFATKQSVDDIIDGTTVVEKASKSILNNDGTYSGFVRNANNVLGIDVVSNTYIRTYIPQQFNPIELQCGDTMATLLNNVGNNDIFEIYFSFYGNQYDGSSHKCVVYPYYSNSSTVLNSRGSLTVTLQLNIVASPLVFAQMNAEINNSSLQCKLRVFTLNGPNFALTDLSDAFSFVVNKINKIIEF